jgi:hypothetical protein
VYKNKKGAYEDISKYIEINVPDKGECLGHSSSVWTQIERGVGEYVGDGLRGPSDTLHRGHISCLLRKILCRVMGGEVGEGSV